MEDDREDLIKKVFGNNKPKVSKYKNKNDDHKDRSMYDPYYGDEDLQDLLEEARYILEYEFEMSIDEINEMNEFDIIDVLFDGGFDELASNIQDLLDQEEFRKIDPNEPYDSIGGHSVNDLKRAFAKTKGRDEELRESSDKKTFNANKFLKMTKTALKNNKIELALNMSEDLVNDINGMSEVVTHLKRALSEIGKANDKLNKLD